MSCDGHCQECRAICKAIADAVEIREQLHDRKDAAEQSARLYELLNRRRAVVMRGNPVNTELARC